VTVLTATTALTRAPGPAPEPSTAAPARRRRLTLDRCVMAASMLAGLVTGLVNLGKFPVYAEGEGVYAMQAWSVLHGRLGPYPYWYDHPFLGWVQIAPFLAAGKWLAPAASTVVAARLAAVAALAVDAGLVWLIARRLGMGRPAGVLAVALFVLSPLVQTEMRRVFLDNISMPWVLAAFAFALSARSWRSGPIRAGVCFAIAVLSKETSLLLAPVLLVAIAGRVEAGQRRPALRAAGWSFVAVAGVYPLYALLRGQLFPAPGRTSLIRALKWQLVDRTGSGSLLDPTSSRRHEVVYWLGHDRFLIVAGLAAAVILLATPRRWPIALAVLVPTLWVVRPGGYLPVMFVIVALPFLALCVAAAAEQSIVAATRLAYRAVNSDVARSAVPAGWLSATLLLATLPAQHRLHDSEVFVGRRNALPAQAVAWIRQNLAPTQRLLVDDVIWADLATAGWSDPWQQAVWLYKVDTDPAARRRLPEGWRDIDYVISTRTVRLQLETQASLVLCREAARHSTVVRTFGGGVDRIEVRRVIR
jgi:hypothetical protein